MAEIRELEITTIFRLAVVVHEVRRKGPKASWVGVGEVMASSGKGVAPGSERAAVGVVAAMGQTATARGPSKGPQRR